MCGSATVAELLTAKSQGRFEATSCLLDTAVQLAKNFYEVAFQRFDEIFSTCLQGGSRYKCILGKSFEMKPEKFQKSRKNIYPCYSLILRIWPDEMDLDFFEGPQGSDSEMVLSEED